MFCRESQAHVTDRPGIDRTTAVVVEGYLVRIDDVRHTYDHRGAALGRLYARIGTRDLQSHIAVSCIYGQHAAFAYTVHSTHTSYTKAMAHFR